MQLAWNTIGHALPKQLFERALAQNHVAHAYLLWGPSGVGKRTLALEFAKFLLGDSLGSANPDFMQEDGAMLDAERLRNFLARLASKPFAHPFIVAVIDNVQALSLVTANILLKTLEEPRPHVKLFLISDSQDVLPTIVSRCVTVHFHRLDPSVMQMYAQRNFPKGVESKLIDASQGLPGRLVQLLHDEKLRDSLLASGEDLEILEGGSAHERLLLLGKLADYEPEFLVELLGVWIGVLQQKISHKPQLYRIIRQLLEAKTALLGSYNKKLILQRLLVV